MGAVAEFTDANFKDEVMQSSQPVLVDFWGPHCAPCRQLAPLIEQLATENAGAIKIGKLDVNDNPTVAQSYAIHNIPTLLFFKDGEVVERFVGMQNKTRLQQAIDELKA